MMNRRLRGLVVVELCACACVSPTSEGGIADGSTHGDTGVADSGLEGRTDVGFDGGVVDSWIEGGADSRPDVAVDAGDAASAPLSCQPGGDGLTNCGADRESCCSSLPVTGGSYYRTFANMGDGPSTATEADPATVSGFRLDKYEVTVGRFRQFAKAWGQGSGYLPPAGSGKHTHLNGGQGLVNSSAPAVAYEPGWVPADDGYVAPTSANLACKSAFATWTPSAGSNETLPINCVDWYEAVAFCIWDGGFLPSESEWEYAAAGGSLQREYPWGETPPGTGNQYAIYGCNYPGDDTGSCTGGAAPVGTAVEGAGLWKQLDLAGNVHEWTLDGYAPYGQPCADCAFLGSGFYRVIRGGYFYNFASYLVSANRSDDAPTVRSTCIGFRCARAP